MDKIKSPEFKSNISQTIKVANNVASQLTNIEQKTVRSYNLNTANINDITTEVVDIIPSLYQNTIISSQEELGNKANPEQLASAFNILLGENGSSKIANNAEDAANNNFIVSTNILTPYWTDKPLKFELQENGTYLISKINEDGTYTAMGYTTAEAVNEYLENLKTIVDGTENKPTNTPNDEPSEVNNSGETFIEKSDTTYITANQLDDNVTKEIKAYADADILGKGDKSDIYNNMSDTAKALIDGKIKVLTPTENLGEIIDKEMDIVIPKNSRVRIDGSNIVGLSGEVLKYDKENNVYKLASGGGQTYTKLEMLSLEITETKR